MEAVLRRCVLVNTRIPSVVATWKSTYQDPCSLLIGEAFVLGRDVHRTPYRSFCSECFPRLDMVLVKVRYKDVDAAEEDPAHEVAATLTQQVYSFPVFVTARTNTGFGSASGTRSLR